MARGLKTPLREFLHTETGGAAILLAATVAALVWVNVDASSYDSLWETTLAIDVGSAGIADPPRVGEQRPHDVLLLRSRARGAARVRSGRAPRAETVRAAAAGRHRRDGGGGVDLSRVQRGPIVRTGWGIALSTDTAFALGLLALVGPRFPDRLRAFMLTVAVVDDIIALVVIATFYTETLGVVPLLLALIPFAAVVVFEEPRRARGHCLLRARRCRLGGAARVGRRAGRARGRDGAAGLRQAGPALESRTRDRAVSRVSRAADRRAGALGRRRDQVGDADKRAAAAAVSPVDELRDRPAVRARERGDRDRQRLPGARRHVADHARDPARLRRRQADRHPRRLMAAHAG